LQSQVARDPSPTPGGDANNVNRPVPGWPVLARVITKNLNLEAFPTFTDLSIKSLPYYDAELIYLRKRLHRAELTDYRYEEDDNAFFGENLEHFFIARDEAIQRGEELPEQWKSLKRSGQL